MKKIRAIVFLLLLSLLFCACADTGKSYLYETGEHTHVFGNRYDITPVSCIAEGTEVRYCKICHESVTETVPVPEDISVRRHAFSDTVIPPTESAEGYTRRACTVCEYVVERTDVIPARYALIPLEGAVTVAPDGVDGVLFSDTASHRLTYNVGASLSVSPHLARRLAVALAITDELAREGTAFSAETLVPLISGAGNGNRYTVRALVLEWIATGDVHVLNGLAFALDGSEGGFQARVNERLKRLGVEGAVTVDVFAAEGEGKATLGATAVMLARALDEPLLCEAFSESVPNLQQIVGQKPVLYLALGNLRVAGILKNGVCYFSLLCGESIPIGVENAVFSHE